MDHRGHEHIRNQANHYGGKWNWDDLEWAMRKLADTDATIEMTSPKLASRSYRSAARGGE